MDWHQIGDKSLSEAMLTRFTDAYMRHEDKMGYTMQMGISNGLVPPRESWKKYRNTIYIFNQSLTSSSTFAPLRFVSFLFGFFCLEFHCIWNKLSAGYFVNTDCSIIYWKYSTAASRHKTRSLWYDRGLIAGIIGAINSNLLIRPRGWEWNFSEIIL